MMEDKIMKKNFYIISAAILSLVACSRNQEIDVPDANLSLFARTESPTESRTVVESGVHVFWEPGDEIAVFTGELSAKFTTDITSSSASATFKGTFGDSSWPEDLDLWAVYPFSEDAVFDGETITTTLPSEQVAREGSFGKDMNLAIAHSNSSTLQFYNVGGGIRFSVTEEGIKKVMFEGLSGEIISGKVKIGFEDGLPVVKEVTGGSQFITLLPPSGHETFEPGVWYYIVAIPGALEGGYKLRFYKDSDYARKVSEKAVEIKRSIYGSLEKADEEIEYEAQTTRYPETEDEWKESVELTTSINKSIDSFLKPFKNSGQPIRQDVFALLKDIDGVLDVSVEPDTASVSFLQKDSVWCNYLLETQNDYEYLPNEVSSPRKGYRNDSQSNSSKNNESYGKALIYVPFQWDFAKPVETWIGDLSECFGNDNVITIGKPNDSYDTGGILDLKEVLAEHYDLIIIDTHGLVGHTELHPKGEPKTTLLATSTVYSADMVTELHRNGIKDNQFGNAYADGVSYVCFAPDFLGETRFDNSAVILSACKSAKKTEYSEEEDNGTMIGAFINRGAAIVTGAKVSMRVPALSILVSKMIEFLKNGFSFQKAFDYLTPKNGRIDNWLHTVWKYKQSQNIWNDFFLSFRGFNIPENYIIECNKKVQKPFFLYDVFPVLDEFESQENPISFTWECPLKDFVVKWPTEIVNDEPYYGDSSEYSIVYDVYVDGSRLDETIDPNNTDKTASYTITPGDRHSWHVVVVIMEDDTAITSYQSKEVYFNVPASISVESVSIDKITLELAIGNTATLTATVLPENATNKNVSWKSSNESVATVSSTGEVIGISKGNAIITVTTEDGAKTATCDVTVKESSVGGDIEGTEEDPWN